MAHYDRVRDFGFWVTGPLLSSEMELIDAALSKAINGDEGGVWAPSSTIEIGGLGIKITGLAEFTSGIEVTSTSVFHSNVSVEGLFYTGGSPVTGYQATVVGKLHVSGDILAAEDLSVASTCTVQGNTSLLGALAVTGNTTTTGSVGIAGAVEGGFALKVTGNAKVSADLTVADDLFVTDNASVDGTLTVTEGTALGDTLAVGGAVSLASTLTVTGAATLNGATTVDDTLTVTGAATISGLFKGKGRHKVRTLVMSDANATVSIADYDRVYMGNGIMTSARTVTISDVGAETGDTMRIYSEETSTLLNYSTSGSSGSVRRGTGSNAWVDLEFIGGAWTLIGFGAVP